jgi:hypothetical protein
VDHVISVFTSRYRLGGTLCAMSDDPRIGIGPTERYALPMWQDDVGVDAEVFI